MASRSIQKTKQPKRDLVAEAHFDVIVYDTAVGQVLDLVKPLAFPADLERPFAVNKKITTLREQ